MGHVSFVRLVGLLLSAGSITVCTQVQKEYVLIAKPMQWDEAQSYCRENHTDLVTIQSLGDMQMLSRIAAAGGVKSMTWTGLRRSSVKSWMWSSGDTPGLADYANWASLPSASQSCGAMRDDGKWLGVVCKTELPFVCQTDDGSYEVVVTQLIWRKAQAHCRKSGKDLARARSQRENTALQEVLNGNRSSFWIGLFRDDYKWSDQSDSSFRFWHDTQPNNDGVCVLYNPANRNWWDRMCGHSFPFFCYNAISVTRWMMLKTKSKSSLYFRDSNTSDALLNQMQSKCAGVKLQWRVQPDGKIFHKSDQINGQYQKAGASGPACS